MNVRNAVIGLITVLVLLLGGVVAGRLTAPSQLPTQPYLQVIAAHAAGNVDLTPQYGRVTGNDAPEVLPELSFQMKGLPEVPDHIDWWSPDFPDYTPTPNYPDHVATIRLATTKGNTPFTPRFGGGFVWHIKGIAYDHKGHVLGIAATSYAVDDSTLDHLPPSDNS